MVGQQLMKELKDKNFTVVDGTVISSKGKVISLQERNGYYNFSHRMLDGRTRNIMVHQFVGYLKFGIQSFDPNLQIRHLDGNSRNNLWNNIGIGTPSENAMDKSPETRLRCAINASSFMKVHNHEAIRSRRDEGASYSELMKEFNISSKGTLSFIINKK